MPMTELERYHATTHHRRPDRLLYHMDFTPDLAMRVREAEGLAPEASLPQHFGCYRPYTLKLQRPERDPEPDWTPYFRDVARPEGAYFDANGCLHVPAGVYHFTHYISPLRNAQTFDDIRNYPWPDWSRWDARKIFDLTKEAHANGRVARVHCTHMYEEAWQVRGYEPFLMDMLAEPSWPHFVLDRFMERNMRAAIAAAEAGADELYTGDDVANQNAMMFAPEVWREFIKSRWARVYAAAKAIKPDIKIWYHSDGNITDIIPELLEIGVDLFNPLQPECLDVLDLKRKYGSRMVMDGVIGTQTVMPFGTPRDVRNCVRERVATLGQDGALILSPTHVLEPEVPIDNIRAFAEACREWGMLA